jgi:hypothetical protein
MGYIFAGIRWGAHSLALVLLQLSASSHQFVNAIFVLAEKLCDPVAWGNSETQLLAEGARRIEALPAYYPKQAQSEHKVLDNA